MRDFKVIEGSVTKDVHRATEQRRKGLVKELAANKSKDRLR